MAKALDLRQFRFEQTVLVFFFFEGLGMKIIRLCALSMLALGLLSEAKAAIIDITYVGTVADGSSTGVFGSDSLTGDAYTLTYQFDTSAGILSSGTNYVQLAGGPGFGPALVNPYSSPGTATLTINSQSANFAISPTSQNPNSYSQLFVALQGTQVFTEQKIQNPVSSTTAYNIDTFFYVSLLAPLQLTTPYALNLGPANQAYSAFGFSELLNGISVSAAGQLDPTSVSVSVSATPLPSSWGMMLLGLGVIGFMAFRRKNRMAFA